MTKTEAAKRIALRTVVWSRRTGQPVTVTMVQEMAEELGISGEAYSVKTVQSLIRREAY